MSSRERRQQSPQRPKRRSRGMPEPPAPTSLRGLAPRQPPPSRPRPPASRSAAPPASDGRRRRCRPGDCAAPGRGRRTAAGRCRRGRDGPPRPPPYSTSLIHPCRAALAIAAAVTPRSVAAATVWPPQAMMISNSACLPVPGRPGVLLHQDLDGAGVGGGGRVGLRRLGASGGLAGGAFGLAAGLAAGLALDLVAGAFMCWCSLGRANPTATSSQRICG